MASLAVLAPTVNKSSNMIAPTSATVLPKKKTPIAGGIRNRFTKAKPNVRPLAKKGAIENPDPTKEKVSQEDSETKDSSPAVKVESKATSEAIKNVGANKIAKETPVPVKKEVSTSQEEPKSKETSLETSPPVKAEVPAEVLPKTTTGPPSRRRIFKALPNVGALANKSSKEAPKPTKEEEVSTSQEKPKSKEVSLETSPPVKAEAPAEVKPKTTAGPPSRRRIFKAIPNVKGLANKSSKEASKLAKEEEVSAAQEKPKPKEVSPETSPPLEVKSQTTVGGLTRSKSPKAIPNIGALVNKSSEEAVKPAKEEVSTSQKEPKSKDVFPEISPPVEVTPKATVGGFTRSEFPKALPNVGALANKCSKEAPKPEKEEVSASQEELKSKEVSQETPAPAAVKAPGRRRIFKAKPNISALANKSAKGAPRPGKEKASALQEDPKLKEVSQETSSPVEVDLKTVEEKSPDLCEEVAKEVSSSSVLPVEVPENVHPVQDVLPAAENAVVPVTDVIKEFPVEETCSEENVAENTSSIVAANNAVSPLRMDSPSPHISPPTPSTTTVAKTPSVTPPDTNLAIVPARVNTPGTPSAHKFPSKHEYPTLKGLLNSSPRKRISSKKNNERRKRFANGAEPPPRSEMTIADLIYFNPAGTAVTVKKRNTCTAVVPIEENIEPVPEEPEEEPAHSGPQVMINEKGEIVLNEASLLVKRKNTIDYSAPVVIDDETTTYSSFRFKASRQWTTKETTKFYKALKLVGTDFALMEKIFEVNGKVTRTRKELKCKYKREERLNTQLVNQCIYDTQTFEISILENASEEEPDDPVMEKKKTRGKKKKKVASPEPVSRSESISASEQSDEQHGNGSELSLVPSEVNASAEGLQEISVQINSEIYHSAENDGTESPAEYTANLELSTSECQNGDTLPVKKGSRKRKIRVIPDSSESSSWEDTSEIYHFPDVAKKSRKARANVIVSSADESQGDPTERVCLSDKNVLNAVELPEHRTMADNLCMDAVISEVSTTRRGRKKKVALLMPSFSSFTPAAEEDEEQCPLVEESEEEVVSMEGTVDSLTTEQERKNKVPSLSSFTPAEEVNEDDAEEQCHLVEECEEEVVSMGVTVDSPSESLQSDATQHQELPVVNVGSVAMEVAGGPSVTVGHRTPLRMSPHHTSSIIQVANGSDVVDGEGQRYFLTQASDSDNVLHVFVVQNGEQASHPS